MNRRRLSYFVDWLIIFLFVAVLIRPLFRAKYLELWGSIESTFIADARFLKDNWPHPNWQPNWYCGTRTDYVYPPALRYGTAVSPKPFPRYCRRRRITSTSLSFTALELPLSISSHVWEATPEWRDGSPRLRQL